MSQLAHDQETPEPPVILIVDELGIIESVGGGWEQAADAGGAAENLKPQNVIGRPLGCLVGNDVTRMYYETVFKICRLRRKTLSRNYRCDLPTHKRFMQVTLTPLARGRVEMRHQLLHEEPFDNVFTSTEADESSGSSSALALRCSVCNQLRLSGSQSWVEPETLVGEAPRQLSVIHTICPACKNTNWIHGRRAERGTGTDY